MKYRKMLNNWQDPYIMRLLRLIETQSKETITNWCVSYAEKRLLPIYKAERENDTRPEAALAAARSWKAGSIKLPDAKKIIQECRQAAREAENNPIAQAAAKAIFQCAGTIHTPTHSAGLIFCGALAVAYAELGIDTAWGKLLVSAEAEIGKMEAALQAIAVEDEPNPAKISWNC